MALGLSGTYVITSDQTTLDGAPGGNALPQVGQVWRWTGNATRLDGPQSTLLLSKAVGDGEFHQRASRLVRRKFELGEDASYDEFEDDVEEGFVVSDGTSEFHLVLIDAGRTGRSILWCQDGIPDVDTSYNVVRVPGNAWMTQRRAQKPKSDVICFTRGTRIQVEDGAKPIEYLQIGERIQTKDNGLQEILWIGTRKMTGARLYAMPETRPVLLRAGALGTAMPDVGLLVSPQHRISFSGPRARALFNHDDVLVSASDLIDDRSVFVDHSVSEVTYYHLLLENHEVIWANGVETESYHPANTSLETIEDRQLTTLLQLFPELEHDLHSYGPFARRNLDRAEAAILRQVAA